MARYETRAVQRGRFAIESTFGTDLTSDVATNFFDLRHKPFRIMRQTMTAPDDTVTQYFEERRDDVRGPRRGQADVEVYWGGSNQALIAAATPTKTSQSKVLEAILGGYSADEGDAVAASPSPTTTGFTVADGTSFLEGQLIGVVVSGVVYPRMITAISTNAISIWPALPSAPATAAIVYNGQQNFLDESGGTHLQVLSEAAIDRGDIWLLRGGWGDLKMSLDRGGLVTWSTTIAGAVFDHDDEITTPQGGSAIAAGTYGGTVPTWGSLGGVHFGPTGSTALSMVRCQSIAVNWNVKRDEIGDHYGIEGVGEYEPARSERTVELTLMRDASAGTAEAWQDAAEAYTDYGVLFWLNSTAGTIRAFCAPTCQIAKDPEPVDVNGRDGLKLTLKMKMNSLCSDQTTAIRRTPGILAAI